MFGRSKREIKVHYNFIKFAILHLNGSTFNQRKRLTRVIARLILVCHTGAIFNQKGKFRLIMIKTDKLKHFKEVKETLQLSCNTVPKINVKKFCWGHGGAPGHYYRAVTNKV